MITYTVLCLLPLVALNSGACVLPCNCGLGEGEDVCRTNVHRCTPLVVRPADIPKPTVQQAGPTLPLPPLPLVPPLLPIPGPCGCKHAIVKPAVVPKPPCLPCAGGCITNNQQLTLNQQQQVLFGGALSGAAPARVPIPIVIDEAAPAVGIANPANYVPADPVSVHLARQMALESNCQQNEDKLSFGFRSIPKDIPLFVQQGRGRNIPEENLYSLNGQIVELKRRPCGPVKSLDEEAQDQLLALAEEEEDAQLDAVIPRRISLGEIGYGPANIKPPTFIDLPPLPAPALAGCKDGFLPGNVIFNEKLTRDQLVLPPAYPPPCDVEGESLSLPAPGPAPAPGPLAYPISGFGFISSSSTAHAASAKSSTYMQNLGCA